MPYAEASQKINAMLGAINEAEPEEPMIRAKMTSADLTLNLTETLKDENGVRLETALAALGALAGGCISVALREERTKGTIGTTDGERVVLGLKDGSELLIGNYVNRKLAEKLVPMFIPILGRYDLPVAHRHLACAISAQEMMQQGKDVLPVDMSARIVMDYAADAAKTPLPALAA